MPKLKKEKIFIVIKGNRPGIYRKTEEWESKTKGYSGYLAKSFHSEAAAIEWVRANDVDKIIDENKITEIFRDIKKEQNKTKEKTPAAKITPVKTEANTTLLKTVIRSPLKIYTDGSVMGKNEEAGGWACVVVSDDTVKLRLRGRKKNPKNSSAMELTAIRKTLKYLEKHRYNLNEACIYTDSKYVTDNWIKNICPKDKNKKTWIKIWKPLTSYNMSMRWVKGHSGDIYNEECDKLAKESAVEQLAVLTAKQVKKKKKKITA